MRRIVLWLASTAAALVLLFSYRTSTGGSLVSSASASGADDGSTGSQSYTGSAVSTQWGDVKVKITVASGKIIDVTAVEYPDGNPRDEQINASALPELKSEVLSAQSAQIDTVSGATVTSDGYISSLQSALDQAHLGTSSSASSSSTSSSQGSSAGGSSDGSDDSSSSAPSASTSASTGDSSGSSSGSQSYTGTAASTRWGDVQIKITVASGKITDVTAVEYPENNPRDEQINAVALPELRTEVLSAQSAQIDTVSGATVTSDGYITSLQSALDQAHLGG